MDDRDPFFDDLPDSTLRNFDDMEVFMNYVKSDMNMEIIR